MTQTPTASIAIPAARRAEPQPAARKTAPYENWRPPVVGVSLLVPVGADQLLVIDMTGRGALGLPVGPVHDEQAPEQAAREVLLGVPGGLPVLRRVAVDWVQMRRRQVITHIMAISPLADADVDLLTYRDGRAVIRMLPVARVAADLGERTQARVAAGLQALANDTMVHLEAGVAYRTEPAPRGAPEALPNSAHGDSVHGYLPFK